MKHECLTDRKDIGESIASVSRFAQDTSVAIVLAQIARTKVNPSHQFPGLLKIQALLLFLPPLEGSKSKLAV
jgi:hypothetical protein